MAHPFAGVSPKCRDGVFRPDVPDAVFGGVDNARAQAAFAQIDRFAGGAQICRLRRGNLLAGLECRERDRRPYPAGVNAAKLSGKRKDQWQTDDWKAKLRSLPAPAAVRDARPPDCSPKRAPKLSPATGT